MWATAVSGTVTTSGLAGSTTRAFANMPGSSRCSGLSSVAWSLMARVLGSTCGSIVVSVAVKVRPGKASAVTSTVWPTWSCPRVCSGKVKLT